MNETALKTKVLNWLRKEFPEGFFWKSSDNFTAGLPDIIGCIKTRMIAIELKVGKNEATLQQIYTIKKLGAAGAITGICYDLNEVIELLQVMSMYE